MNSIVSITFGCVGALINCAIWKWQSDYFLALTVLIIGCLLVFLSLGGIIFGAFGLRGRRFGVLLAAVGMTISITNLFALGAIEVALYNR